MGFTSEQIGGGAPLRLRLPANFDALKVVAQAASAICSDLCLDCGPAGITAQVMDRAHTVLLSVKLESSMFSEYQCARPVAPGVDADWLVQALCAGYPGDSLELLVAADMDHVRLRFTGGPNSSGAETTYDIKLRDLDSESLSVPEQAHSVVAWLPSADLWRLCRNFTDFAGPGAAIHITGESSSISFRVANTDDNLVAAKMAIRNSGAISVVVNEPCGGAYSLRYFAGFAQAVGAAGRGLVRLGLAEGKPFTIEYAPWGGGRLQLFLAPLMEASAF